MPLFIVPVSIRSTKPVPTIYFSYKEVCNERIKLQQAYANVAKNIPEIVELVKFQKIKEEFLNINFWWIPLRNYASFVYQYNNNNKKLGDFVVKYVENNLLEINIEGHIGYNANTGYYETRRLSYEQAIISKYLEG